MRHQVQQLGLGYFVQRHASFLGLSGGFSMMMLARVQKTQVDAPRADGDTRYLGMYPINMQDSLRRYFLVREAGKQCAAPLESEEKPNQGPENEDLGGMARPME